MRRIFATLSGMALAAAALVAPSLSAHAAQDVSYLFVVDSTDIRVTPLEGDAARVEISRAAVTRFTDRPAREAESIGTRGMLREFGWTAKSKRLKDSTPNAAISIAGERSQIVDIKRARVADGRVVLRVVGINGPLESMRGAGSIFIDNALTYPLTQSVDISLTDTDVPTTLTTATVVIQTATTATVTIDMSRIDPGLPDRVLNVDIGNTFEEDWTENDLAFTAEITSELVRNTTLMTIALEVVGVDGSSISGLGRAIFAW
jgi:hypothetical protein